jgi:hypothetical protein
MAAKISYRDLERENKRLNDKMRLIQAASIKAAEHLTGMMAKRELAVLMLESVNEQAANSHITKNELFQWRLRWNALKGDETQEPTLEQTQEAFAEIGVNDVAATYQDIYDAQEKIVSEVLLGYVLALEKIG